MFISVCKNRIYSYAFDFCFLSRGRGIIVGDFTLYNKIDETKIKPAFISLSNKIPYMVAYNKGGNIDIISNIFCKKVSKGELIRADNSSNTHDRHFTFVIFSYRFSISTSLMKEDEELQLISNIFLRKHEGRVLFMEFRQMPEVLFVFKKCEFDYEQNISIQDIRDSKNLKIIFFGNSYDRRQPIDLFEAVKNIFKNECTINGIKIYGIEHIEFNDEDSIANDVAVNNMMVNNVVMIFDNNSNHLIMYHSNGLNGFYHIVCQLYGLQETDIVLVYSSHKRIITSINNYMLSYIAMSSKYSSQNSGLFISYISPIHDRIKYEEIEIPSIQYSSKTDSYTVNSVLKVNIRKLIEEIKSRFYLVKAKNIHRIYSNRNESKFYLNTMLDLRPNKNERRRYECLIEQGILEDNIWIHIIDLQDKRIRYDYQIIMDTHLLRFLEIIGGEQEVVRYEEQKDFRPKVRKTGKILLFVNTLTGYSNVRESDKVKQREILFVFKNDKERIKDGTYSNTIINKILSEYYAPSLILAHDIYGDILKDVCDLRGEYEHLFIINAKYKEETYNIDIELNAKYCLVAIINKDGIVEYTTLNLVKVIPKIKKVKTVLSNEHKCYVIEENKEQRELVIEHKNGGIVLLFTR